ncbi:RNA polymerase sigma factor [Spirosoma aerophilum]
MKALLNDEELIRQHFSTNPSVCFETLYNRYVGKVYNRCLSITKDSEKAQDFTQDIFIRTFGSLDHFQERSSFSTWLYSISFNYCMDQIKRSNRLPMSSLDDKQADQLLDLDESEPLEERLHMLTEALKHLPEGDVNLLRMKYQQGMSLEQIAVKLDLKLSTVKMRLKRSREKLQRLCSRVTTSTIVK